MQNILMRKSERWTRVSLELQIIIAKSLNIQVCACKCMPKTVDFGNVGSKHSNSFNANTREICGRNEKNRMHSVVT